MAKFSRIVCDRVLFYVYRISATKAYQSTKIIPSQVDPGQVVYIGKGKNNRAFSHYKELWFLNGACIVEFVAMQLTKETAAHMESVLISAIGLSKLENIYAGLGSQKCLSPKDIIDQLDIIPLVLDAKDIGHTLLVVYEPKKTRSTPDLYNSASRWWVLNSSRAQSVWTIIMMNKTTRKIEAVIENINKVTQEAVTGRLAFDNATQSVSQNSPYLGKWVDHLRKNGSNPVQYL